MDKTFNVLTEKCLFKNAVVLSVITNDINNDKYLLYVVNDYEDDDYNFMISYLRVDRDGYNYLEKITNKDEVSFFRDKLSFLIDGGKVDE